MPYQHCPACRLTVHVAADVDEGAPCPRCGAGLADQPRSLFVRPAEGRFAHRPTPPRISSAAVRDALAVRGGRRRSPA
jgi:hypothetical protein